MSVGTASAKEEGVLLVRIPLKRRTRGGRQLMVAFDARTSTSGAHPAAHTGRKTVPEDPILKALGRAWRWKRLIETGMSIADLAAAEKVDKSYLCRLLRLTLLCPAIIEAILDSKLSRDMLLAGLISSAEIDWARQSLRTHIEKKRRALSDTKGRPGRFEVRRRRTVRK